MDSFLVLGRSAKVIVDADAGDTEPSLQAGLLDLSEVIRLQRTERPHIEIHALKLEMAAEVDEGQVVHLLGLELRLKAQRQTTQAHHRSLNLDCAPRITAIT